jgi:hypothetical protein
MIEVLEVKDISKATLEELEDLRKKGFITDMRRSSPQERTRAAVMATGNRWAMENFNATHN